MGKEFDWQGVQEAVRALIVAIGDDPNREGLKDTPTRVANMYAEVFAGVKLTNDEIAEMFNKCFEEGDAEGDFKDLVLVKDIPIFSYCEHHIALMYNMKVHVAYIPKGKVIGLSKIARIADMVGRRLQLQEKIGSDIAECMVKVVGTDNVAVIIEGEHSCMTARGIKKPGVITRTSTLRGIFNTDSDLRRELYSLIK